MTTKSKRPKYQEMTVLLVGDKQREYAHSLLNSAPLDELRPLEMVIREKPVRRKLDANAAMWAGPLRDISEQAFVNNRLFSAEVWHEMLKEKFLPEDDDPELTMPGYRKWEYRPDGKRYLKGSTTELTVKGFSEYLTQIEAFGAELGVKFSAGKGR